MSHLLMPDARFRSPTTIPMEKTPRYFAFSRRILLEQEATDVRFAFPFNIQALALRPDTGFPDDRADRGHLLISVDSAQLGRFDVIDLMETWYHGAAQDKRHQVINYVISGVLNQLFIVTWVDRPAGKTLELFLYGSQID